MRQRLRAIFLRHRAEEDLDDELDFHVEMQTLKNIQAGLPPPEALKRAKRQFGRDSAVKEECREQRYIQPIETLRQDVSYALRGFRRTPVFALTVIATIGLGLGVNTALFSIFNAYVLRPLEVRDPYSLVQLYWSSDNDQRHPFNWPQYQQLQSGNPVFSEFHAVEGTFVRINGSRYFTQLVTGNYFRMLGAEAQLGRTLMPEDSTAPGGNPVAVISSNAWLRLFNRDPNILGKKVILHGYPFEVVGVAREGFTGMDDPPPCDFWVPITMHSQIVDGPDLFGPQSPMTLAAIARLKPGLSIKQAQAILASWTAERLTPELWDPKHPAQIRLVERATRLTLPPDAWLAAIPLFVAFGLILLIACANVANMMLARAMARQREIGIRLSLGAARSRLIRQLLTESVVLALPAAAVGFVVAQLIVAGGVRLITSTLPAEYADDIRFAPLDPDYRVFAFMMAVAVLSGIVFGLAPALQATSASVVQAARGDFGHQFRPQRLRNALVIVQISVSVLLLICAGVMLKAADHLHGIQTGIETRSVLFIELVERSRERILAQLARQSQVQTLACSNGVPLMSGLLSANASSRGQSAMSSYSKVCPEYFEVVEIPVKRGRTFTLAESLAQAPVAVISESLAKRLWPDREAIGQSLQLTRDGRNDVSLQTPLQFPTTQVIGIVRDVNTGFLENKDTLSLVYFPTNPQAKDTVLTFKVKGDPDQARREIDTALTQVAPGGVNRIHRLQQIVTLRVYPFRMMYWISAMLGTLALLLTLSGIYGVISYLVEQRQREMGIRMALGATGRSLVGLVLKQSLRLAALGVLIGTALALVASRLIESVLVMVRGFDATAYAGAILTVLAACLAAAVIPSLRAARVDPVNTLRHD